MLGVERRPPGFPPGRLNRLLLAGLTLLLVYQLYQAVTLNFFPADAWVGSYYLIDKFGHVSVADIIFRLVMLLALLALSDFRRKYRFVMAGCVASWLATAVGAGARRYFLYLYGLKTGLNLHLFSEFPWRWAVIGSATLTGLATLLFILALLTGEHVDALLRDWAGYLPRKWRTEKS